MSKSERVPPRFVPTLTEVVEVSVPPSVVSMPSDAAPRHIPPAAAVAPAGTEAASASEVDVHRIMQRVDLALEARLRAAVAHVVAEQVEAMGIQLRDEIELAVRDAVSQAVAEELASSRAAAPGRLMK